MLSPAEVRHRRQDAFPPPELSDDHVVAICRVLIEHDVDFVVIGGIAARLHDTGHATVAIDICPSTANGNLARLAKALRVLGARLRVEGDSAGVPFDPHPDVLGQVTTMTLITPCMRGVVARGPQGPLRRAVRCPAATARPVNYTRRSGGRVIAVGTTVVRALESVVDDQDLVRPGAGWTDVVVSPQRGAASVDGLLTGWHEPRASHLLMLEAVTSVPALRVAYTEAVESRYRWHEFGDVHLIVR